MKIILAFALVAAVAANPPRVVPIELPEAPELRHYEEPSIMPEFIPQELADALRTNEFAELPQDYVHPLAYGDVPVESFNLADAPQIAPTKVRIADHPEEIDQFFVHPLAYAAFDELSHPIDLEDLSQVNNAEQPEEFDQTVQELTQAAFAEIPQPIKLEEPSEDQEFDQFFVHPLAYAGLEEDEPVKFDNEVVAEEAATPVKFVDQASDVNISPIQIADLPEMEADFQPQEFQYPAKMYDNNMLR